MATIASLNSKLTLNTTGFRTGMQKAGKMVTNFGSSVVGAGLKVAKYGAGMIAVGGAATAYIVKGHMEAIDVAAKLADTLGISTEALAGFKHGANLSGVSQEALTKGLKKLSLQIGEVRNGSSTAAAAFKQLGLDGAALTKQSPEEAMFAVADAIKAQPDAAGKASAAYAIFGKSGQDLLPMLSQGADGLRANAAEAKELGLSFSRIDAAKVEAANDAMTRVQSKITGAGQSLAIALAPYVEAVANKLLSMGGTGESMASKITGGVEWVVGAVAKAADWLELFKSGFYTLRAGAMFALSGIIKGIASIGDGLNYLLDTKVGRVLFGGAKIDTSFMHAFADGLGEEGKAAWADANAAMDKFSTGESSKNVAAIFADIRSKAQASAEAIAKDADAKRKNAAASGDLFANLEQQAKNAEKVKDTLADLQKQFDRFGLDGTQVKLLDLKELGATNDQLEQARVTMEKIARMERDAGRKQDIEKMLADLDSEVRTIGLSANEKKLLELDALGATQAQLDQAKSAMDQIDAATKTKPDGPAGPASYMIAGSAEAQQAAYRAGRGLTAKDETPKQQLAVQRQMAKNLDTIARNSVTSSSEGWDL